MATRYIPTITSIPSHPFSFSIYFGLGGSMKWTKIVHCLPSSALFYSTLTLSRTLPDTRTARKNRPSTVTAKPELNHLLLHHTSYESLTRAITLLLLSSSFLPLISCLYTTITNTLEAMGEDMGTLPNSRVLP